MAIEISDVQPCSEGMRRAIAAFEVSGQYRIGAIDILDEEHHELVAEIRDLADTNLDGRAFSIFVYDAPDGAVKFSAVLSHEDFPIEQLDAAREATRVGAESVGYPITLAVSETGNLESELIVKSDDPITSLASAFDAFVATSISLDGLFEELLPLP
ncbi:hypothetical protein [Pseudomonas sp. TSRC2-2]|uniref:hypothetical protein n=1 Tax=Pseudomonas sp. TSRC2-2 TaxID=2804571 RepID=UPI003CEC4A4D